ncbi:hypothetical protein OF83DRAFT_268211 [Amylostereum chailletii]|nr:hypothetical protein OF83DRAFT_268211 [Amylostereum chailletii]
MDPLVAQLDTFSGSRASSKQSPDIQVLVRPPFYDPAAEIQRLRNARILRNIMLFTKVFSAMRGAARRRSGTAESLESAAVRSSPKDAPALLPTGLQHDLGDDCRDLHSELQDYIQGNRWPLVFKLRKVPSERCHRLPPIPEDAVYPTTSTLPNDDEAIVLPARITSPTVKRRGGLTPLYALEEEEEEETEDDGRDDGSDQASSDGEESRGSFEGEWGDVFILDDPSRLRKPVGSDRILRAQLNLAKTEIASLQSKLSVAEHQLNHGRKREKQALTALARQERLNRDLKSHCSQLLSENEDLKCKYDALQRTLVRESCGSRMSKLHFDTVLQTPPSSPDYTPPSPLCPLPDDYDDIQPVHPAEFDDGHVLVVDMPEQDAKSPAWAEAMSGRVSRLGLV